MSTDLRQRLGRRGEQLAGEHLERLGLRVIERNYRTRWGEIDLIACDDSTIVFCEVKTRRTRARTPFESIRRDKQRQVRKIAASWLAEHDDRPRWAQLRFDAIAVTIGPRDQLAELEHLEGAF